MGPPAVSLVLVVVLGLTATLPGPTMVHAEGSSVPDEDTTTVGMTREGQVNHCSPLQKRQDLLDSRLNELHNQLNGLNTGLNTQQNEVNTRLSTQQNEVNTRLNRMDSRLDGIETAISASIEGMKDYLQKRMDAMEEKVRWALSGNNPHGEKRNQVSSLLPRVDRDVKPVRVPKVFNGCQDAFHHGNHTSGTYTIVPEHNACTSFDVYCEQRLDGGGWTVFQARKDGTVDFYRNWYNYTVGFGDLKGDFWLGNRYIHLLTKQHDQQLKIELMSPEGEVKYADYSHFWVADESDKFRLHVAGYSGGSPPGDSMDTRHNGSRFSTKDQNNDLHPGEDCAKTYFGGWWYGGCHQANLNGLYGSKENSKGLNWSTWKGFKVSMRATRMLTRKRP